MQPGLVSIMMPAYNAEQYIGQAIESVLAQTYDRWELVVVDDGSTDGTAAVVARYDDPRIRMVHQANAGEAAARNNALRNLQGDHIAFLDADDAYLPEHLRLTVDHLESHPERGGVYTDGYYCDGQLNRLQTLSSRRRGPFEGRVFEQAVYASDLFGPPVCVVLRRQPIEQHQLQFDTSLVMGPDWDFLVQFSDVADFGYLNEQTCLYRLHSTNITLQTHHRTRASHKARCREKAIKMTSFGECSAETRQAVFYDLLVNLLRGSPEKQEAVTHWREFDALPRSSQALLLRLAASQSLMHEGQMGNVGRWFERARALNPKDMKGALLSWTYALSPQVCRSILRIRMRHQIDPLTIPPFADMNLAQP